MKPPAFEYVEPRTVEETVETLAEAGEGASLLAGGQSLLPLLNRRRVRPAVVVDINRVRDMSAVEIRADRVRIGAMARLRELERHEALRGALPVLPATVRLVAHPQIRSRSTVGGSLSHADPAAELPALAVALGARMFLRSAEGERTVSADDFFRSEATEATDATDVADVAGATNTPGAPAPRTARRPGEVLTAVEFPRRDGFRFCFVEIPRHGQGGFPLVGVCLGLDLARTNGTRATTVTAARLAGAGVADRPVRLARAEEALRGRSLDALVAGLTGGETGDVLDGVLDAAEAEAAPPSDLHGSAAFRTALLRTAVRRALGRLAAEARTKPETAEAARADAAAEGAEGRDTDAEGRGRA
ncbi:FAD binding domain-containing protein [Streptomyces sp. NPDC054796]